MKFGVLVLVIATCEEFKRVVLTLETLVRHITYCEDHENFDFELSNLYVVPLFDELL